MKIRYNGKNNPFIEASTDPQLVLPGDVSHGAWEGSQRGIHLFVEQSSFEELFHKNFRVDLFGNRSRLNPDIPQLLNALYLDVKNGHPSGSLLGETIAAAILQRLLSDTPLGQAASEGTGLSQREFKTLRAWIDAHLTQSFSLQDLAAEIGISVRQLHRDVLRATGMPPYRYILMRRVERARHLIVAGRLSLSEVALMTGFYDQAHMAHTFRKLLGVPPSHFSNKLK